MPTHVKTTHSSVFNEMTLFAILAKHCHTEKLGLLNASCEAMPVSDESHKECLLINNCSQWGNVHTAVNTYSHCRAGS